MLGGILKQGCRREKKCCKGGGRFSKQNKKKVKKKKFSTLMLTHNLALSPRIYLLQLGDGECY